MTRTQFLPHTEWTFAPHIAFLGSCVDRRDQWNLLCKEARSKAGPRRADTLGKTPWIMTKGFTVEVEDDLNRLRREKMQTTIFFLLFPIS